MFSGSIICRRMGRSASWDRKIVIWNYTFNQKCRIFASIHTRHAGVGSCVHWRFPCFFQIFSSYGFKICKFCKHPAKFHFSWYNFAWFSASWAVLSHASLTNSHAETSCNIWMWPPSTWGVSKRFACSHSTFYYKNLFCIWPTRPIRLVYFSSWLYSYSWCCIILL